MKIEKSKISGFAYWYVNGDLRFAKYADGRKEFWKNGVKDERKH